MSGDAFLLQQLLGGSGSGWVSVAFLVSLFAVLAFRPERIHRQWLFRVACGLLALSIALPPLVTFGATFGFDVFFAPGRSPGRFGEVPWALQLAQTCGPLLLGSGVFCGLWSLIPPKHSPGPTQPTRHPLE